MRRALVADVLAPASLLIAAWARPSLWSTLYGVALAVWALACSEWGATIRGKCLAWRTQNLDEVSRCYAGRLRREFRLWRISAILSWCDIAGQAAMQVSDPAFPRSHAQARDDNTLPKKNIEASLRTEF